MNRSFDIKLVYMPWGPKRIEKKICKNNMTEDLNISTYLNIVHYEKVQLCEVHCTMHSYNNETTDLIGLLQCLIPLLLRGL